MSMLSLYDVCFKVGVLFTVVTFLLGQFFDFMDFDGDLTMDGDISGVAVSPLKPVIITAYITVFGGVGIMALNKGLSQIIAFLLAISIAFGVAALLFKLVIVPLHKAQSTSAISQGNLIGHKAKVDVGMKEASFGKISYTIGGNSYTAPAKAADGEEILKGEMVRIVSIKDNTYYVNKSH
ncbi:NfeD family protein [Alkaliphilus hydrothermalis]|uniref:Membrane protein implicated in regulation of membrane protease activity n=1 Tax=Alkaliphilus hydrothermalis TaxID=1482730 RepID=A0ABS2NKN4_9FIRM|nr:NfeD family protein [Alkaliphilus hydrothermalis]MBM7613498.1 membrane protein implicated in regulation of membrane protease activity [Alkaliphilus hydrothermalis]